MAKSAYWTLGKKIQIFRGNCHTNRHFQNNFFYLRSSPFSFCRIAKKRQLFSAEEYLCQGLPGICVMVFALVYVLEIYKHSLPRVKALKKLSQVLGSTVLFFSTIITAQKRHSLAR